MPMMAGVRKKSEEIHRPAEYTGWWPKTILSDSGVPTGRLHPVVKMAVICGSQRAKGHPMFKRVMGTPGFFSGFL